MEKYEFKPPKKDDPTAEFDQKYLSKPQMIVLVQMCNSCTLKAANCDKKLKVDGCVCLILPLCRTCIFSNRRSSQTNFFNIGLKNLTEKERGDSGSGDDSEGEDDESSEKGVGVT